ncbi:hypothetical protein HAX54_027460 [Datura stramonium]|uniref:Uncharacterized protein n=1 Tax=Datura stramonium TaxID=4076 RepID=A0ABS8S8U4_DATST|nr:hypothetical protein [Datura stramonium]
MLVVGVVGGKVDVPEDVPGGLIDGQEKPIEPTSTSHTHPDTFKVVSLTQNGQPQNDAIDSTVPTKREKPNAHKRKATQKKKAEFRASQIANDQVLGWLHSITESDEDPKEADHFIYDQPQQTLNLNPETPNDVQNPTLIACDPPDPVFAVCNLNTSGCRDFDADEYKQVILEDDIDSDSEEEPKNTIDDAYAMQLLQAFGTTTSQMSDAQVKKFTDRQGLSPRGVSHFSPGPGTGPLATRTRLRVKNRHPHD